MKLARRILLLGVLPLVFGSHVAWAADVTMATRAQCLTPAGGMIEAAQIEACRRLPLEDPTLSQKDIASINVNVALAFEEVMALSGENMEAAAARAAFDMDFASRLDPKNVEILILSATRAAAMGDIRRARQTLFNAALLAPDDARIKALRAAYAMAEGADHGAGETCDAIAEPRSGEPFVLLTCAAIYKELGRLDDALVLYQAVAKVNAPTLKLYYGLQGDHTPWREVADTLTLMGRDVEAEQTLSTYMDGLPQHEIGWRDRQLRGSIRRYLKDYKGAAEDFAAAVLNSPPDYVLTTQMAEVRSLSLSGQPEEAETKANLYFRDLPRKAMLKFQLYLKLEGVDDLEISGTYDDGTRNAVVTWLKKKG